MSNDFDTKREQLLSELQDILQTAEELFDEGKDVSADEFKKLKKRLTEKSGSYRQQLDDLQEKFSAKTRQAAKQSDALIQDNPYKAIGIAAGVAFVAGLLINRK
ncbi:MULTISPECIES: DUF883 family protein [Testudinibacter]|uniref:DUF883 domain-containing protein n=1 Tax=Testudinibacter aquarius TaxID=1524974 RepID=A0A4R3Y1N5_9PAST|nr:MULTISPECIES: DUF883 family protein [Testudinibacter]TNG96375.1 DUF883 domain-containing protein [Pasteurellaceae bacterium UScroc12]TNG98490.1 DUF883 domain-containing protein [Pasteurellaceae bacterium UScroc31]TNG98633.1 DUF883 domain-containing protein [Pasteurellaceae bacterium USgator41]TNH03344.1 DUF883 domain-containing protein [Pasteurellaceae bacterium USgator11]TNH04558.1 DUF883 domain-containing protein [Pasteurellaceae bacterium Phil11]TNH04663.1 DUF883 domain-containing prote